MIENPIHFFAYHKVYLIIGAILLFFIIMPGGEKISHETKKFFYLAMVVWIICFAYRVYTGQDIRYLFDSDDRFVTTEAEVLKVKSPFNSYYSNDVGRKPQGED